MASCNDLKIKIRELKSHYLNSCSSSSSSSSKDDCSELSEAISFYKENQEWSFWMCCCHGCCSSSNEKFRDADVFMQHIREKHLVILSPEHRSILPKDVTSEWVEMIMSSCSWKPLNLNEAITMMMLLDDDDDDFNDWPLSDDDPERTILLEKIRDIFRGLVKNRLMSSSHIEYVMYIVAKELRGISYGSNLYTKVDQSPLCICFLGAPQLNKFLEILQRMFPNFDDEIGVWSATAAEDDSNRDIIVNKITISKDHSFLVLDEHFLDSKDDAVTLDSELASCKRLREEKAKKGRDILELLRKEYYSVPGLCERKDKHSSFKDGLQTVMNMIFLEEQRKREGIPDFVPRCYYSVLMKRQEELMERGNLNTTTSSNRNKELRAIQVVLKDAEILIRNKFRFEMESCQDDDQMTEDRVLQVDSCINDVIKRLNARVLLEIFKGDARIMKTYAGIRHLEVRLCKFSSHDFRALLIPITKSFLQARLKSDAASKAFLAELDDNQKTRTKDDKKKKRNKKNRMKNRDPKTTNRDELNDQTTTAAEEILPQSASDDAAADALRMLEEERKLAENLDYQRRIENEAKHKCLADQMIVEESESSFLVGSIECKIPVVGVRNVVVRRDAIEE